MVKSRLNKVLGEMSLKLLKQDSDIFPIFLRATSITHEEEEKPVTYRSSEEQLQELESTVSCKTIRKR